MEILQTIITEEQLPPNLSLAFHTSEMLFDIETTGLSSKNSQLYLIGCCFYEKNRIVIRQFFCENTTDEVNVLNGFSQLCESFNTIISFNGDGFDIPYLEEKYKQYDLKSPFTRLTSVDLYKIAKKIRHFIPSENLKQKSIESALGLYRKDPYSGKELIQKYKEYLCTKDILLYNELALHNFEDVKGMLHLFTLRSLVNYEMQSVASISAAIISQENYEGETKDYLILTGQHDLYITQPLSYHEKDFYLVFDKDAFRLSVECYNLSVKVPYSDYKNYVYLPLEDMAIPKTLATGISKQEKEKCNLSNCYGRKNVDDVFLRDEKMLRLYCEKVIAYLLHYS